MNQTELQQFCDAWLHAWTGNRPEHLLSFYTEGALYQDPAKPEGICGREQLQRYFTKLLARNPDWVWRCVELIPHDQGFTLKWEAMVPVGERTEVLYGLDLVELSDGKISRNEVYFDPRALAD